MQNRTITWADPGKPWTGEFQGAEAGSGVSIIFNSLRGGAGPRLHRHPYPETFLVRRGTVIFSDGVSEFEAREGQIVVVGAGVPHRFAAKSDEVEMVDIHASRRFVTEWLEKA